MLWERSGEGWLSGTDRLGWLRLGWSSQLRSADWALDAMTGKGCGNEFFQIFHRGLLMVRRKLNRSGSSFSREILTSAG